MILSQTPLANPLDPQLPENLAFTRNNSFDRLFERILTECKNPQGKAQFISERLSELKDSSAKDEIYYWTSKGFQYEYGRYDKFIHPETSICSGLMYAFLYVDDAKIYELFIDCLEKRARESAPLEDRRLLAIAALEATLYKYFGTAKAGYFEEYKKLAGLPKSKILISELEGKQLASCTPRTAVSQNILSFIGLSPTMIMSKAFFGRAWGAHSYTVLRDFNGPKPEHVGALYDATNPFCGRNADGWFYQSPAIYYLDAKQLARALVGKSIKVEHTESHTENEHIKLVPNRRFYGNRSGIIRALRVVKEMFCEFGVS